MEQSPVSSGVVVLLTDFGLQDDYVGQLHATVTSVNPDIRIVDLCHSVPAGNVRAGAFLLYHDWDVLPERAAVAVVVDPGVGTGRFLLAAKVGKRYLVAPDNGILSPLLEDVEQPVVHRLDNPEWMRSSRSFTFHGRDCMVPAAARLASGFPLEEAGPKLDRWETLEIRPTVRPDGLTGEIFWVDRFGNLITNLPARSIDREKLVCHERELRRVNTFAEAGPDETVWLVGSKNTVEIVCNGASAAERLGAGVGDIVTYPHESGNRF